MECTRRGTPFGPGHGDGCRVPRHLPRSLWQVHPACAARDLALSAIPRSSGFARLSEAIDGGGLQGHVPGHQHIRYKRRLRLPLVLAQVHVACDQGRVGPRPDQRPQHVEGIVAEEFVGERFRHRGSADGQALPRRRHGHLISWTGNGSRAWAASVPRTSIVSAHMFACKLGSQGNGKVRIPRTGCGAISRFVLVDLTMSARTGTGGPSDQNPDSAPENAGGPVPVTVRLPWTRRPPRSIRRLRLRARNLRPASPCSTRSRDGSASRPDTH